MTLGVLRRAAAMLALAILGPACVAPALNDSQYRSKVDATASDAISAIQSARLTLESVDRNDLPFAPMNVALSDTEVDLSSISGTFASVQPPDREMDLLRERVLTLLDQAGSLLQAARIQYRRGDLEAALLAIEATNKIGDELDAIQARY